MKGRVLAVEDTPSLRALLEATLARAGYRVTTASDGEEAARAFETGPFDAVVMDLQMPVLDGLGAVSRMRACEKARGTGPVPILALTANADPAALRMCLENGFTGSVRKPFAREDLLEALSKALGATAELEVAVPPEFAELVPAFLESCRSDAAALLAAHGRGDLATVAETSHRLVGAGASFGFAPLTEHARRAEAAARAGDAAGAGAALSDLSAYVSKLKLKS